MTLNNQERKARKHAREYALQALYQWQLSQDELLTIEKQFLSYFEGKSVDLPYFEEILFNVPKQLDELDQHFSPYLDRSITDLDPIELMILRMATYELLHRLDIPYRVCINESLELTKTFGSIEGYKYINGILDKVAKQHRPNETV